MWQREHKLCHDIENKWHVATCNVRRTRRPLCPTPRNSADNRLWRDILPGTKSRISAVRCSARKVGSLSGKHATRRTIPPGRRNSSEGLEAIQAKRLKRLNRRSSICTGRWCKVAKAVVPRPSGKPSNSKALSLCPHSGRSIASCSVMKRGDVYPSHVLYVSINHLYIEVNEPRACVVQSRGRIIVINNLTPRRALS